MFVSRRGRSGDHLEARVRLMGLGAAIALVGIATNRSWLINIAIGVLVLGFGLRFVGRLGGGASARSGHWDESLYDEDLDGEADRLDPDDDAGDPDDD